MVLVVVVVEDDTVVVRGIKDDMDWLWFWMVSGVSDGRKGMPAGCVVDDDDIFCFEIAKH